MRPTHLMGDSDGASGRHFRCRTQSCGSHVVFVHHEGGAVTKGESVQDIRPSGTGDDESHVLHDSHPVLAAGDVHVSDVGAHLREAVLRDTCSLEAKCHRTILFKDINPLTDHIS